MQVSSTKSVSFKPITVTIVVETEREYDTIKSLAMSNESVPGAIKRGLCCEGKYSEETLIDFQYRLYMALKKD